MTLSRRSTIRLALLTLSDDSTFDELANDKACRAQLPYPWADRTHASVAQDRRR